MLALQASAGTNSIATALVTLWDGQAERTETASGDGPVNALCEAINRITGLPGEIQHFHVASVTEGADAQGEVFMKVQFPDGVFTGSAISTDIVSGSAQAYLHAVNRLIQARTRLEGTPSA